MIGLLLMMACWGGLQMAPQTDCSATLNTFPKYFDIAPNSCILLEGNIWAKSYVHQLQDTYPIYLQSSKGQRVELEILEEIEGVNQVQVWLKPKKVLSVGETYYLRIDNLGEAGEILLEKKPEVPFKFVRYWTVTQEVDLKTPSFINNPKWERAEKGGLGDPVDDYAIFTLSFDHQEEVVVETEVQSLSTGATQRYYVHYGWDEYSNHLFLGSWECGGSFLFAATGVYKVRFRLVDACRNRNPTWSIWTTFLSPYQY